MTTIPAKQQKNLDESFDAMACRPLGKLVAKWFMQTTISANQVSGMAALCGMAAGAAFAMPWPIPGYGAILMFTMMVLDCADGEVARQRGGGGWRGRMLDGLADFVTAFSVHLGMLFYLNRVGGELYGFQLTPWTNFLLAAAAGASFAWRSGVVDDIKQRLKAHSIDRELAEHKDEPKNLWDRFLYWLLTNYVENIKRYSGKRRPGGYTCFRRAQFVGPTHQHLAMVIAGLAVSVYPQAYLAFFVLSVVPANLYLLMVLWLAPKLNAEEAATEAAV
jgi:hypothetical protein